jgi:hypothetical protein
VCTVCVCGGVGSVGSDPSVGAHTHTHRGVSQLWHTQTYTSTENTQTHNLGAPYAADSTVNTQPCARTRNAHELSSRGSARCLGPVWGCQAAGWHGKKLLPPRPGAAPARAIDAPHLAQGGGQSGGVAGARRREQGAVGQGTECAAGKGVRQSCARVKARTLVTPACAWVVSNECTAAAVAPQQVWLQRAPHSLLRAGHHCSAAPYRQGTCARTRMRAGVWRQFVALVPMPTSQVAKRCVGRLRSPTSLAAPEALQSRWPHAAAARRRAESKARAVEFGASCACSPAGFAERSMPSAYERVRSHPLPTRSLEIV